MSGINNASTSMNNGRPQIMNLGSDNFDVKQLLDFDLQVLEQKKKPYETKISEFKREKDAWESLKKGLNGLQDISQKLGDFSSSDKNVDFSNDFAVSGFANNRASDASYKMTISSIAESHKIAGGTYSEEFIGIDETVEINGKEIEVKADMSLRDLAKEINKEDAGVEAIVLNNRLVLTSEKTGEGNEIVVSNSSVFNEIGLTNGEGDIANELTSASNAMFNINGIDYEQASNEVNDIEGLTLNIKQVSTSPIEISVNSSEEELIEMTKELVETYNDLMGVIESLSGEGEILQGKRIPQNAKFELNNVLSQLDSDGFMPVEFGINFDRDREGGRITLDENILLKKFEEDKDGTIKYLSGRDGFAKQLENITKKLTSESGLITTETKSIDENIKNAEKTLDRLDVSFEQRQESLIFKYAQLEVMMNQLEMQNKMLTSQLNAFNNQNG